MQPEVKRTFDILERYLSLFPREDALAGKQGGKWYTYSTETYLEKSQQFAIGVLALGLEPGSMVATITANRPEWNFVDMGLAMAGMVHVPIYPTIGDEEYQYILQHSEAKLIIAGDKKLYDKMSKLASEIGHICKVYCFEEIEGIPCYDEILELGEEKFREFEERLNTIKDGIDENDVVTLIYTSGTTGTPKGVMLTHKNLVSNFVAHSRMHDLGARHKVISFLPLCHVYERSMNYHFQYKGMGIYYVGNLGQIMSALKEVKPDMFNTVPRLLERIYDGLVSKGKDLPPLKRVIYNWAMNRSRYFDFNKKNSIVFRALNGFADRMIYSKWREALGGNVKYIVSGGAALQPRIARVFGVAGVWVLEGYGLTETSPVIAVNNPLERKMKIGTVGPILNGNEVKIDEDGEILTRGPHIMKGYYKAPELTAEVIDADGWFHTGDIGILDEGIYLKITDRKKEMFKLSGGKYIAPQMIENKLKESFFIEQAMVIGENEKFASALISPNFEYLHDWCSKQHIQYRDNAEMIQKAEVFSQFMKEVTAINKTLGQHEEIKRFRLVCEEWSPQSGELSPTLKLRRNYVKDKYRDLIDEIYLVPKNHNGVRLKIPKVNISFDLSEFKKRLKF